MCKIATSGVKDEEEVLMDCDYPSWDLEVRKFTSLHFNRASGACFQILKRFEDLWTDCMRSPMPLPKSTILSFGHLFVIILQPTW